MAKEKTAVYFQPETMRKIEQEYKDDNCASKTEFIEKAVTFYIGKLPIPYDNRNGQGADKRYGTAACPSDV